MQLTTKMMSALVENKLNDIKPVIAIPSAFFPLDYFYLLMFI